MFAKFAVAGGDFSELNDELNTMLFIEMKRAFFILPENDQTLPS